MRYVLGTFPGATYEGGPLPSHSRVVFQGFGTEVGGYFDLISPRFENFSQPQCRSSLGTLNNYAVLSEADLPEAIAICRELAGQFSQLEEQWQYHQGSVKKPGQPEVQIYLTLRKRRLMAVLSWLERTFELALCNRHCVVFGSGVWLRVLLGFKLPPGTEVYS